MSVPDTGKSPYLHWDENFMLFHAFSAMSSSSNSFPSMEGKRKDGIPCTPRLVASYFTFKQHLRRLFIFFFLHLLSLYKDISHE